MKKFAVTAFALTCLFPLISSLQISNLQAVEIHSQSSLQLRQGPGMHYAKTGKIAPGQSVEIGICNPSWCHVNLGKKAGWVQTVQINPNLARISRNGNHYQTSSATAGGGGGAQSSSGRMQASTTMMVSLRIIAKNETQQDRASLLPFPVPAHRQIRTR